MGETTTSPAQQVLNTSDGPVTKVTPAKKEWDDMTEAEQAAERKRLLSLEAEANKPDPNFDKFVDSKLVAQMKNVFGKQKRHKVMLMQVTPAMEAAGVQKLPPRECGVNGYNFVVPRGVPLDLPEGLIHILHQANEITDLQMAQLGLISYEKAYANMGLAQAEAEKLANLGKPL